MSPLSTCGNEIGAPRATETLSVCSKYGQGISPSTKKSRAPQRQMMQERYKQTPQSNAALGGSHIHDMVTRGEER
ncbi:hypothetical protein GGTG_08072 [Gaeumannomyces tritici R3-111a-1]|uniref:Uncharacterized protein n=1 Tax=Gaeumannomyces tritici (strain R3-111a-1) TaxID=644352 RepID=J3P3I6_GAET3|nr:hypothetical protein GGTG_08072 [Gaeumannomyces tritici R3-111a-1]EJT74228.1 hypothetical protein GGTG_08072 [Gaeumannomyces tritici R3-111a-1]